MNISDLLHDAVGDIEPGDRLDEIRARTAHPERSAARPWFYAAGGVVLATAAAVAAFAVLGGDPSSDPGPAHHGHEQETFLVPAYFVGDTPRGERLYREFDEAEGHDALDAALARIQEPPADPDYRTPWPEGSFGEVSISEHGIDVERTSNEPMDDLAVQQVVYTLQAAAGERLPVWFWLEGQRGNVPVNAAPQNDVLSLMSISDPAEGNAYEGSMIARGRANSNESNVLWELRDQDDVVVADGFTTAAGWMDKLYDWEVEIDLTGVPAGDYVFVALTDDPSGGAEGFGPDSDTRSITVR
ncbi:Gmad2 immunoglobulin-like domain-containing protein [Nocardioides sp. SR21]|uniref:Gmad2 immunoglobulin-like domain-containing protein n=1 Tax=Nocardioides sp. SR21 TaxID=2919501 RepID=UPI001FAB2701|nr:Gmad2 immunoglobulin-like domain-containing protein [Nocardioides sp. SR21]